MPDKVSHRWDYLQLPMPLVQVSVVATEGSAPRRKHSFMSVYMQEGSVGSAGSVGGGALEHFALREAQRILEIPPEDWYREVHDISLGVDLRQSCGGRVTLLFEYLGDIEKRVYGDLLSKHSGHSGGFICVPYESGKVIVYSHKSANEFDIYSLPIIFGVDRLYLFGAGHVGRAVAYHVSPLDFSLVWVDFAEERFPDDVDNYCDERWLSDNPADLVSKCEADSYYLVMSHSHALDYEIVDKILGRGDFYFLGLIGSVAKGVRFRKGLRRGGHSAEVIERLVSPLGLVRVSDNTPHAIAISAVAQLLDVKNT